MCAPSEGALRGAFRDLDQAAKVTKPGSRHRERVDFFRGYLHYLLLRYQLQLAEQSGEKQPILAAIRAETEFGGRLSDTNAIHTRALIGKAFERRFRKHLPLLRGVDTAAWRAVGTSPDAEEIRKLWEADRKLLGL